MLLRSAEEMVLLVLALGDTIRAMSMDCQRCDHTSGFPQPSVCCCALGICPHTPLTLFFFWSSSIMFKNLP